MKKRIKIITKDKNDRYWNLVWNNGKGHVLPDFSIRVKVDKILKSEF